MTYREAMKLRCGDRVNAPKAGILEGTFDILTETRDEDNKLVSLKVAIVTPPLGRIKDVDYREAEVMS